MTVTYTGEIASAGFFRFLKLLFKWRGGIFKLLWKDILVFVSVYYSLTAIYHFGLNNDQKRVFERISRYCNAYSNLIPVAFVLGFFINLVVGRWWGHIMKIPFPDRLATFVTASIVGHDERGRLMRRTIMRYANLAYVIMMSCISPVVKKRFPTFQHMTAAGLMLQNEEDILMNIKTQYNKYFVPLVWATSLIQRARTEGRIKDDFAVKTLNDEVNAFRGSLAVLYVHDWIPIPLVYTQVVIIAVHMFTISSLMGKQLIGENGFYFPIFTFFQYIFYVGWLKVAECLLNPFGEDDEDIDLNGLIDRNLQVSYLVVDEMHNEHPELIKDQYWDDVQFELPYTHESAPFRRQSFLGSAVKLHCKDGDRQSVRRSKRKCSNTEQDNESFQIHIENCTASLHSMKHRHKNSIDSVDGKMTSFQRQESFYSDDIKMKCDGAINEAFKPDTQEVKNRASEGPKKTLEPLMEGDETKNETSQGTNH